MSNLRARLEQHMQVLCRDIGERHLGSRGEARAVEYIAREYEALGYEAVREEYQAPGWTYDRYSLSLADVDEAFSCFPCFYSNACAVTGKLVPFELRDAPALTEQTVRGRICFAQGRFVGVENTNEVAERLEGLGAAAMIITSPYPHTVSTKVVRNPDLKRLAVITVSQETAAAMARHAEREFALTVDARNFPTTSWNVVGRRRGQGSARVVIGAHYDTAPGIQGAWDNATGVAVALELARMLYAQTEDCPVDFVAFGGEEFGGKIGAGLGGYCYAEAHKGEWSKLAWMGCVDGVGARSGRLLAAVGVCDSLRRQVEEACAGAGVATGGFHQGSDNNIFHARGIPTVLFIEKGAASDGWPVLVHAPEDNLDMIDPERLTAACRLIADTFGALMRTTPGR